MPPALADPLAAAGFSGLLAERIAEAAPDGSPGTWAVWLRVELLQRVVWAGNPDKNRVSTPGGLPTLTPRRSFASWREEVRGRSAPFTAADVAGARLLAAVLTRAFLRRAEALARVNHELRRRHEDLRFFADAAVHDLREPLWQIQVFSSTLREDLAALAGDAASTLAGAEAAALVETARVVESSAARMRLLVDALSHFATAGRHGGQLEPIPLAALLGEAASDLDERIRAAGATLVLDLEEAPDPRGDAAQLRRLFQNLLSNAIKYRSPERPPAIRVDLLAAPPGRLRLRFADNGIGFDEDDAERIFEPFRRLDSTAASGEVDGMGLGLAICRRIAEAHDGSITAQGRPGEGAAFLVELPLDGPSE